MVGFAKEIWSQGSFLGGLELVERATGRPLGTEAFERHLERRYVLREGSTSVASAPAQGWVDGALPGVEAHPDGVPRPTFLVHVRSRLP